MEALHIVDRAFERGNVCSGVRAVRAAREFRARDRELLQIHVVKAARQALQRRIAVAHAQKR